MDADDTDNTKNGAKAQCYPWEAREAEEPTPGDPLAPAGGEMVMTLRDVRTRPKWGPGKLDLSYGVDRSLEVTTEC